MSQKMFSCMLLPIHTGVVCNSSDYSKGLFVQDACAELDLGKISLLLSQWEPVAPSSLSVGSTPTLISIAKKMGAKVRKNCGRFSPSSATSNRKLPRVDSRLIA
nr:hypothetical protein CFP56_34229 [Quercus suber]